MDMFKDTSEFDIARLVKSGGYLFVSDVDLAVRSKVALDLGWRPVTQLISEIHDGDPSLRRDWPLHYWSLEPLDQRRDDWEIRYASVFQLAAPAPFDATSRILISDQGPAITASDCVI